jgi:hypothetical protein
MDVKTDKDVAPAVANISKLLAGLQRNSVLYIPAPLDPELRKIVLHELGHENARRVQFMEVPGGFYRDGKRRTFDADKFLITLGSEKLKNTFVALEGDCDLSASVWNFYEHLSGVRLLLLSEWLGQLEAFEVKTLIRLRYIDHAAKMEMYA